MGKKAKADDAQDQDPETETPKTKKKAKKSQSQGSVADSDDSNMNRTDVSSMLGHLKYHAGPASKASPEFKLASQRALQQYQSLGKDLKPLFLPKFMSSKKDMSWTKEFEETQAIHQLQAF